MRIKWEPRDIWVGLYWTKDITNLPIDCNYAIKWYLCIIPCFPIMWTTYNMKPTEIQIYNQTQRDWDKDQELWAKKKQ